MTTADRREYSRKYYIKHREALLAKQNCYHAQHRDECLVRMARNRVMRGVPTMSENKSCSLYLGCHVAERVLTKVFKDVDVMPRGNPGYDFICGRGYKVDVKSSCVNGMGGWKFDIGRNVIADYFLCLSFDNRKALTPLCVWLIPGTDINHLISASIAPSTLSKWSQYELDNIDDIVKCCDTLR